MRLTRVCFNYFKKYIQSHIDQETGFYVQRPLRPLRRVNWYPWRYTENRPWTDAAKKATRQAKSRRPVKVDPVREWTIFKGDRVMVLVGKDKGKLGIVDCIIKERSWCFVTGLNCRYEWMNQTPTSPGTMTKVECPLLVTTEVALVDPSDEQPTKVEMRYTEDRQKVRVSLRTGRVIPLSGIAINETEDMVDRRGYKDQPCDTLEKELHKITFECKLATFEQDIMDCMGIVDTRKRAKTYWY